MYVNECVVLEITALRSVLLMLLPLRRLENIDAVIEVVDKNGCVARFDQRHSYRL